MVLARLIAILFLCSVGPALAAPADGGARAVPEAPMLRAVPEAPMLRIEAGQHNGAIRRLDVDRAGRYLVTASHDKTARIWSLADGRLLRVLRPAIAPGDEGRIDSVAMSPDGRLVALGGFLHCGTAEFCITVFERQTGKVTATLDGLEAVPYDLAFSPDGRFLAAGLAEGAGVRVWQVGRWDQVMADRDYGGDVYGVAFDPRGRLATVAWDDRIRMYNSGLRRIATAALPGRHPYSVTFHPEGDLVAVGYARPGPPSVLNTQDLQPAFDIPHVDIEPESSFGAVAWSADGRYLYGAGNHFRRPRGTPRIRRWADGGRGPAKDLAAAANVILDLAPVGAGVVFSAADPAWGLFDAQGDQQLRRSPAAADLRGMRDAFRLSPDGRRVRFGLDFAGTTPVVFDLAARTLQPAEDSAGLAPPITEAPGLTVTDWRNGTAPRLNGRPLDLAANETARSLAIAPDHRGFVLGGDWSLRRFDALGRPVWTRPAPAPAWSVNISADNRVVAAAFGDGTIRWYRYTDGAELLVLFVSPRGRTWIAWTPAGSYDTSPGGEGLIGWHLNTGPRQAAEFFSAGRFRDQFYAPRAVSQALDPGQRARLQRQEEQARLATAELREHLPPVVTLTRPADGARFSGDRVRIAYEIRSPSQQPITGLRIMIDGRPVQVIDNLNLDGRAVHRGALTLPVPPRDLTVGVIAEADGRAGEPAEVSLDHAAPVTSQAPAEPRTPPAHLYALVVGVADYIDDSLDLRHAGQDARDLAKALESQRGRLYQDTVVRVLTDDQADRVGILDGLDWLERETTAADTGVLFLAGHGVNDPNGRYFFLPQDGDTGHLRSSGILYTDIRSTLGVLPGKAVMMIDTCHAGNALGQSATDGSTDITALINDLSSAENGVVVFASSTGNQVSVESDQWGNGAFTEALLEGVDGRADSSGDGVITAAELDAWLRRRVADLTTGRQTPTTTPTPDPERGQDFPLMAAP